MLGIIGMVASCLTLLILIVLLIAVIIGVKTDSKRENKIKSLIEENKAQAIRFSMLDEMFNDYKEGYPIKTKYRVNARVFIVEAGKPYVGNIVEIHQNYAREITYTVQFVENKKSAPRTIVREEKNVYISLADAIESEKLMSL